MPLAQASLQQHCNHWQACRHSDRKDRQVQSALRRMQVDDDEVEAPARRLHGV